jgi:hypothetical protein
MYTHIYISSHQAIHMFTYKNTFARRTVPHLGTKIGSPAYIRSKSIHDTYISVPLSHPHLLPPQEEVVAHHHLPQVVVVEHPQDHPAPAAGIH